MSNPRRSQQCVPGRASVMPSNVSMGDGHSPPGSADAMVAAPQGVDARMPHTNLPFMLPGSVHAFVPRPKWTTEVPHKSPCAN